MISGAQAWPEQQLRVWLHEAGFDDIRRSALLVAPNFLMQAR